MLRGANDQYGSWTNRLTTKCAVVTQNTEEMQAEQLSSCRRHFAHWCLWVGEGCSGRLAQGHLTSRAFLQKNGTMPSSACVITKSTLKPTSMTPFSLLTLMHLLPSGSFHKRGKLVLPGLFSLGRHGLTIYLKVKIILWTFKHLVYGPAWFYFFCIAGDQCFSWKYDFITSGTSLGGGS